MKFTFPVLLVIFSCILTILATTPAQIIADIDQIITLFQKFDTDIKGISSTNIVGALTVHTDAGSIITAIESTLSDINALTPLPISEADAEAIIAELEKLEAIIPSCLNDIIAKKSSLAAIPISGLTALVLQDLKNMQTAIIALEEALLGAVPLDVQSQAAPIVAAINNAFAKAIAAYS